MKKYAVNRELLYIEDKISKDLAQLVDDRIYLTLTLPEISKQKQNLILKFCRNNRDLLLTMVELSHQYYQDRIVYGYYPWNYVEEMVLNLEKQK